jgi:hypothetical protein
VCDAGGGTVDLVSYEITSLSPDFKLKELTPPDGKPLRFFSPRHIRVPLRMLTALGTHCGSLYLNRSFAEYVRDVVGHAEFDRIRGLPGFTQAMDSWDKVVKKKFLSCDERYVVHFPMAHLRDDMSRGVERDSLVLSGQVTYAQSLI